MKYYDEEERSLIESIENGKWVPVGNLQSEIDEAKEIARATITKDTRINIRLTSRDLKVFKTKTLEEGIPYQTLVSSILHKYVSGKLVNKQKKS